MKNKSPLQSLFVAAVCASLFATESARAFPEPSRVPTSWELKFVYQTPKRIVVEVPGEPVPKAYWYMTYTVTNTTDTDQQFLPVFEMVTRSGTVIRSDRHLPTSVFQRVQQATGNSLLEHPIKIAGTLRVGADQAKDGVAIWEETEAEMGSFSIFVAGVSGESAKMNDSAGEEMLDKDGKLVLLFKTMQLDYTVSGDEVFPGNDPISKTHQRWVMR